MNIDERCYGYEPAASQLKELRNKQYHHQGDLREIERLRSDNDRLLLKANSLNDDLREAEAELVEVKAERDKILQLWLEDADPSECGYTPLPMTANQPIVSQHAKDCAGFMGLCTCGKVSDES